MRNSRRRGGQATILIGDPVFLGESKRETQATQFLRTVHRGMIHQLKADLGYSGFTCKNPLHEHWPVWSPRSETYDLEELLDWLNPLALKFARRRTKPSEEIDGGRNVALLDQTRKWAYRWVLTYKETATYREWERFVLAHALERNAEFAYPLMKPEVGHTAKSIAGWTWEKFSKAGFSEIQSQRDKKSGEARSRSTETLLKEIIGEMREAGEIIGYPTKMPPPPGPPPGTSNPIPRSPTPLPTSGATFGRDSFFPCRRGRTTA